MEIKRLAEEIETNCSALTQFVWEEQDISRVLFSQLVCNWGIVICLGWLLPDTSSGHARVSSYRSR